MKITIELNTENVAFEEPEEVSRLLKKAAVLIASGSDFGNLKDYNGNTVGHYKVTE